MSEYECKVYLMISVWNNLFWLTRNAYVTHENTRKRISLLMHTQLYTCYVGMLLNAGQQWLERIVLYLGTLITQRSRNVWASAVNVFWKKSDRDNWMIIQWSINWRNILKPELKFHISLLRLYVVYMFINVINFD